MATPKKTAAAKAVAPARPKVEAKSTAQDAKVYRVASNLYIDGLKLKPGDTVELTDDQAAGLDGFVEPGEAEDATPTE